MEKRNQQRRRIVDDNDSDELTELYNPREEVKQSQAEPGEPATKKKRGKKKIPDQWSRVISISDDDLENIKIYELIPDMQLSTDAKSTLTRGK